MYYYHAYTGSGECGSNSSTAAIMNSHSIYGGNNIIVSNSKNHCLTDLFDQVQLNVPWRLREDLTVPAPHHITLGRCPVSLTGHQEPCLITATADSTHSGYPTSSPYPDSDRGFMNKADYTHSSPDELASASQFMNTPDTST